MDETMRLAIEDGTAQLKLDQPIEWKLDGRWLKSQTRLHTVLSHPMHLSISIPISPPHSPTFLVRDGSPGPNNALRLDVRGSHRNTKSDGVFFNRTTHLHQYSDRHRDSHAVHPEGWPPDGVPIGTEPFTAEHIELIMSYFCRISGVRCGSNYTWGNPFELISTPQTEQNVYGDEIP